MKLIVDSGSTKVRWALCKEGKAPELHDTEGFNPAIVSAGEIQDYMAVNIPSVVGLHSLDEVYFYGAGCLPHTVGVVADAIASALNDASVRINVESDILGATRALLGRKPGIACILGTGSNSCLYDGNGIVDQIPPLGFILGDEGSGAVLGRRLLGDVFKRQLPDEIIHCFLTETGLAQADVIRRVYRSEAPNTFLASLSKFLHRHIGRQPIEALVIDEFCNFFKRNVCRYKNSGSLPVAFTGSIAAVFEPQLRRAAQLSAINIEKIVSDPLPGLIKFHSSN